MSQPPTETPQARHEGDLASTGVEGLDEILRGGLARRHVYLLEGDPGTGKTTLAVSYLLAGAAKGERCLYVTLSESAAELRQMAQAHGWSLDGIELFEVIPLEASLDVDGDYTVFHAEEVELGQTTKLIVDKVEELSPTRVVLDSLAELRLLARDSTRYRKQLLGLKRYFTGRQTTVLMLDDRTSLMQDKQLHSLVHGVISLERLPREYGPGRRRLEVAKMRGRPFLEGYHDYRIQTGGISVYPRLVAAHQTSDFVRGMISSGVRGMDDLLGGGLDRGSSALIVGPSGAGKTTLATRYALAAADRAEPATIYTFDENLDTLLARAEGLSMPLRRCMEQGGIRIEQIDPAELSPGEFTSRVRETVDKDGAKMIVIDSLNGYMSSMPEEEFLTLQMHELLSYLNQHGVVTILILAQQGVLGQSTSAIDLSYLADTIVLLRFFESSGAVHRAVSVVKKRCGAHEQTIREMKIGKPDVIEVGEPLTHFRGILTGVPQYEGPVNLLEASRGGKRAGKK